MSAPAPPTSEARAAELADLAERLTARVKAAGGAADLEALVAEHPEHSAELRRLLPAMVLLADLSRSADAGSGAVGTIPAEPLGDFQLLRELGRGGMGVVYEAMQLSLGRRVALKVLPLASTMDARQLQRFRHEAQAAALLHHPHIVPVHGVGCERGVHYYAMQLIDGRSLAQVIAEQVMSQSGGTGVPPVGQPGPVGRRSHQASPNPDTPPLAALSTRKDRIHFRRVAERIAQAADALEYAHSMGVVHRDVKPANLLLDRDGRLWVTDFGLAKWDAAANLTLSGDLLGTLRYMSPEQALAKRGVVDHRTDVYSLGATLYELLTLRPAVPGEDKQEVLRRLAFEDPAAPRTWDRAIPAELETIALKALAKEPAERYPSAAAMAEDLRCFLEHRTIRARRPTPAQRVAKWARRHHGVAVAAVLALAGIAVAAVVAAALVWREQGQTHAALTQAEKQAHELRRQVYEAKIGEAYRAWEHEPPAQLLARLDRLRPEAGAADFRGFEWYYLRRLARGQREDGRLPPGHVGDVYCVTYSPDGRWLATAGKDWTIRLWDAAARRPRAVLTGHTGEVNSVAFTPDGRSLVSGSDDGTVRTWDVATGRETGRLLSGSVAVPVVAVAAGRAAAGTNDGLVHVWELPGGRPLTTFRTHVQRVEALAFSPDGVWLAAGADFPALWDAATGKPRGTLRGAGPIVRCLRFSRDGKTVVETSERVVRLYEPFAEREVLRFAGHGDTIESAALSREDRLLATAGRDATVRLWDARTGRCLNVLTGPAERIWSVAFTPNDQFVTAACRDGTVRFWGWKGPQDRDTIFYQQAAVQLAYSQNGAVLAYAWTQLHEKRWRVDALACPVNPSSAPFATWECPSAPHSITLAPDGRWAAIGHRDGTVTRWDLTTNRRETFQAYERSEEGDATDVSAAVHWVAIDADGRLLTNCHGDRRVRVWDGPGRLRRTLTPPGVVHTHVAVPADGRTVATEGSDGLTVWDVDTGRPLAGPVRPGDVFDAFTFSPDGSTLAVNHGRTLVLYDAATLQARTTIPQPRAGVSAAAIAPDGRTIAVGSVDETVRLFSTATGWELLALDDLGGRVEQLAFRPDGRELACSVRRRSDVCQVWLVWAGE